MADPSDVDWARGAAVLSFRRILAALHYAYPTAVFLYYMAASAVAVCTLQTKSTEPTHPRRRLIKWSLIIIVTTYFAQLLALGIQAAVRHVFPLADQDTVIGIMSCILAWGVVFTGLSGAPNPVWHPYVGAFGLALLFEPVIGVLAFLVRPAQSRNFTDVFDVMALAVRYLAVILAAGFYFEGRRTVRQREKGTDAERQSLLKSNGHANGHANGHTPNGSGSDGQNGRSRQQNGYGATSDSSSDGNQSSDTDDDNPYERRQRQASEQMEKRLKEKGNWFTYAKSFKVFFPYIWPVKHRSLQLRVVLVGLCLLAMNFINVLIPRQLGIIMDSLSGANGKNPWNEVLIFAGLKLVASEAGLSLLRQWLWIPVEYYSFGAISTAAYSHVLNLSSDFHDSKSSSDIMMAISCGQSISNILDSICFRAVPMLIDMIVAFTYLSATFGPYEGFITVATAAVFMYIATHMIAKLKGARKNEVGAWYKEHYVRQAGIQGWSTVASFNQIGHEEDRYSAAVKDRVAKTQKVYFGYVLAYAFQFLVLLSGLLAGAFLAVYQVTHGDATPGDFIMLLTYWAQLVAPLTFFASLGKTISRDLLQAEQLLEIMQTKPTVVSKEGAPPLRLSGGGEVRFDGVYFSYDKKKEILKDVNFTATPGMTVAFVGATGAGKSTILKLLDRFYDVTRGSISIDGQDIRDVDLYSLRAQIGVVPQAPILFDDTIMNNVRYAKLTATDEEVYEACKAACIHEQILGFTDGYQTRVGERGVKLSGGELQRVAIARAILKRPSIVLLDEATSAVDTETEQKIQEALRTLCEGRTTFIVAHRLSTIVNADRIIVIAGGEIVEQGSHDELIGAGGRYAELWSKQIFVKPKDKGSDDDDKLAGKTGKGPTIVNDLSAEVTSSEMAKVKSTPAAANGNGVDRQAKRAKQDASGKAQQTTPGHGKEASHFNPEAPAFTPRSFASFGFRLYDPATSTTTAPFSSPTRRTHSPAIRRNSSPDGPTDQRPASPSPSTASSWPAIQPHLVSYYNPRPYFSAATGAQPSWIMVPAAYAPVFHPTVAAATWDMFNSNAMAHQERQPQQQQKAFPVPKRPAHGRGGLFSREREEKRDIIHRGTAENMRDDARGAAAPTRMRKVAIFRTDESTDTVCDDDEVGGNNEDDDVAPEYNGPRYPRYLRTVQSKSEPGLLGGGGSGDGGGGGNNGVWLRMGSDLTG